MNTLAGYNISTTCYLLLPILIGIIKRGIIIYNTSSVMGRYFNYIVMMVEFSINKRRARALMESFVRLG